MKIFIDQLNRKVCLPQTPQRIISLVPSQTELLVDLGLEEQLVGITKFCVHPEKLKEIKTIVGGTKKVNYKKVASLKPDVIICNKEENTAEMIVELEKIAPVWISDIYKVSDCLQMITQLGSVFQKQHAANSITKAIIKEYKVFQEFIEFKKTLSVAYVIWKEPWMVAGKDTFIDSLLQLNNFKNLCGPNTRYPEVNETWLQEADVILLSSEPFPFKEEHIKELRSKHGFSKDIRLVDGEFFSWYGSRLMTAFAYFKSLHP